MSEILLYKISREKSVKMGVYFKTRDLIYGGLSLANRKMI